MNSFQKLVLLLLCGFFLLSTYSLRAQDDEDYEDDEEYYEDEEDGEYYDDEEDGEYYDDEEDEYYDEEDEYYDDDDDDYSGFPLKVGIGLPFTGFALGGSASIPESAGSSSEIEASGSAGPSIFYLEPQFAVVAGLSLGLRYELFALLGVDGELSSTSAEAKVTAKLMQVILGYADYYILTEGLIKPSVGVGLGFYSQTGSSEEAAFGVVSNVFGGGGDKGITERYNSIGITPRVRINIWRSVIGASYHYTLDSEVYDYICVNLGFEIGGGI